MRKIKIFDTTLRDGEQSPGCFMSMDKKVEVAKMLDKMNVDVIEAGFAASNENDFEAIKMIGKVCKNSVITSLARCNKNDIDKAYEALTFAKHKRIHVFIATSDIHMKYKLRKNKEEIKQIVNEMVSYAKSKFEDVEFSLEDATRTDKCFACEIIDIAINSGATTINIPDTVGYTTPDEFYDFLKYIKNNSSINKVNMSVHCHNDLGMATANTMSAIKAGANQVECTINGIGERAGNTALEEVVANVDVRKNYYDCYTDVDKSMIYEASLLVSYITGSNVQNNKPIVGKNAFKHEAGIHQDGVLKNKETYEIIDPKKYGVYVDNMVIGVHSGRHAIENKIIEMGYSPKDYNIEKVMSSVNKWFINHSSNEVFNDVIFKRILDDNKNTFCKVKRYN